MNVREIFASEHPQHKEATQAVLATRVAKCSCGKEEPSSLSLAFFEFRGPGSNITRMCDICGFNDVVHWPINPNTGRSHRARDHTFVPRSPLVHDTYYCGCRGWD